MAIASLTILAASGVRADAIAIPLVPTEHPRLYVRPSDLDVLRARTTRPEMLAEWVPITRSTRPMAMAFHHLLMPGVTDPRSGANKCDAAIAQSLAELTAVNAARNTQFEFLHEFHQAAAVYDWCYQYLTTEQKRAFIANFVRLARGQGSPGYPVPADAPALVGHAAQGWVLGNQLAAGVAIHDEDPTMYRAAASVALDGYRRAAEFLFGGVMDLAGVHYARHDHFITANWLFRALEFENAFPPTLARMPYEWIYSLRPDGRFVRSGDTVDDDGRASKLRYTFSAVGAYYNDPMLVRMGEADYLNLPYEEWSRVKLSHFRRLTHEQLVLKFIFLTPELKEAARKKSLAELPRVLFGPSPAARMLFRTGWQLGTERSRDAVIDLRIGEYFIGNHQRLDFGTFQVYYRGPLAVTGGVYQGNNGSAYGGRHWLNYYHQTVSVNGLLVVEAASDAKGGRNGGQFLRKALTDHPPSVTALTDPHGGYRMGALTGHLIGAAEQFAYIAGDITAAYSDGPRRVARAMVALRTGDSTAPAALVIADDVITERPAETRFVLHTVEPPKIDGRRAISTNERLTFSADRGIYSGRYGGKLVVDSLLPAYVDFRLVKGHITNGIDYSATKPAANGEEGWGRLEIASTATGHSKFLTVLQVTDAAGMDVKVPELSQTAGFFGTRVANTSVQFAATSVAAASGGDVMISGTAVAELIVVGLAAGGWRLLAGERTISHVAVPQKSNAIWFASISPGRYRLAPD